VIEPLIGSESRPKAASES